MAIPDPDRAAVKREFEALKANTAKLTQFSKSAMLHGYFFALEQARIDGSVGSGCQALPGFGAVCDPGRLTEACSEGVDDRGGSPMILRPGDDPGVIRRPVQALVVPPARYQAALTEAVAWPTAD